MAAGQSSHPIRVYADTSVYGGVFDDEFAKPSQAFFGLVRQRRFLLVHSILVSDEISRAPEQVQRLFDGLQTHSSPAEISDEAVRLHQAYLDAGIVGPRSDTDALHVAVASVSDCRLIVSWNFKHIVHFQKIPLYNGVNQSRGYAPIAIHSPEEVITNDDEDV